MPYITAVPDIVTHEIGPDDLFVVNATDGIWDVMENEDVGKFVVDNMLEEGKQDMDDGEVDADMLRWIGRKICAEATVRKSGDNVTAVVASLVG